MNKQELIEDLAGKMLAEHNRTSGPSWTHEDIYDSHFLDDATVAVEYMEERYSPLVEAVKLLRNYCGHCNECRLCKALSALEVK